MPNLCRNYHTSVLTSSIAETITKINPETMPRTDSQKI
uniref:Uncharacterized protein n=1 Tax=Arundo donax TaxID=35708 RepID=A0A0A9C683_ARUDO